MNKLVCILFLLYILYTQSSEGFQNLKHNQFHCPQSYRNNMMSLEALGKKNQYSGYTDNAYIDITRFINTDTEPLPVNPDFFK